jgi:FkbM family methyltransferase
MLLNLPASDRDLTAHDVLSIKAGRMVLPSTFKKLLADADAKRWCQARFKSSLLFEAYLHTVRREWLKERTDEIKFYKRILGHVGQFGSIFDIGANIGNKAEVFQHVAPRVYCLEPDRANASFLRQRFWKRPGVTVIENAVSDRPGTLTLSSFEGYSALNTVSSKWLDVLAQDRFGVALKPSASREVPATTLDELIDTHGVPVYVKIDVEGHELSALHGLSRPVPFLSFEVNLPEFRAESLECVARLASLRQNTRFNYVVSQRAVRLEMDEWLPAAEFSQWLGQAAHSSFEVFATTVA